MLPPPNQSMIVSQVSAGATQGGDVMAQGVVTGVPELFAQAADKFATVNATMSGGAGLGFGFTLQCSGTVIFTYGGGGTHAPFACPRCHAFLVLCCVITNAAP